MLDKKGAFRFTYFTDKYQETFEFYEKLLGLEMTHYWDRNEHDKGAVFGAGAGLIEILHRPEDENHTYAGLDYRVPQGAFMCIQVWNIDELFESWKAKGVPFKLEIMDQPWGHRSFYVKDPNDLILTFFQEQF